MIYVVVFLALVFLRWGLLLGGTTLLIPRVRRCPACFDPTLLIQRPWLRLLVPWLEWRWCPSCGWRGPGRRSENDLVPSPTRGAGNSSPRSGNSSRRGE